MHGIFIRELNKIFTIKEFKYSQKELMDKLNPFIQKSSEYTRGVCSMRKDTFIDKIELLAKDIFDISDVKSFFEEAHINTAMKRLVDSGSIIKVALGAYICWGHSFDVEKLATKLYYQFT